MAIKASATITLSFIVDVKATYRYYKLQASTASTPSVPTAFPPGDWTDTEPNYTSGSTNTLYIVDCTVYANDTFTYSSVSKSSSYEAAKEAYNKATNAQDTANDAYNKADDAYNKADEASKVATNYIKYEDNNGLIVGDMTTGTLTKNVRIDADSVDIRDGDVELASFSANRIDLGKASPDATISMRDGDLVISNFDRGDHDYTQIGCYGNFDVSALVNETTEVFKRGGILTTIEANTNAEWHHLIGLTWNDLTAETWNDLQSSSGSIDKGEFFETRIYADNTDRTTENGFNTSRIYLRNSKNASTNRITSEIGIEADEVTIDSPLYVTGDIHTPSIRTSSEYNWLGRYRFHGGWIGFYPTPLEASTNSNRLGWMGYDNSTTNFTIGNLAGGNNYVNKAWTVSSDERLKEYIRDVPDVFVNIWRELEPKIFKWNHLNFDISGRYQFGLIAQDVISIFEKYGVNYVDYNLVNIIEINGVEYFSITYDHYHMLTALALKAAMNRLDSFESRLERLEALIK